MNKTFRSAAVEFISRSVEQTHQIGLALGNLLQPGDVIALSGQLGAGKTCLVRGIAEGAGADPALVSSPTFVLIQEYQGRIPVYHFDAYRLRGPDDMFALGSDEYFSGDGACLVEWAERVDECLPEEHLHVEFDIISTGERRMRFKARGERYCKLIEELKKAVA